MDIDGVQRVLVDFYVDELNVAFGTFMLGAVPDPEVTDLVEVQLNTLQAPPPLDTLAVYDVRGETLKPIFPTRPHYFVIYDPLAVICAPWSRRRKA